jgi:1-acyl-sn-glycerol-3-phosphate acyltransferase
VRISLDRIQRMLLTGSAFLLFFQGGAVLSYLVLPLSRLGGGAPKQRARRCRQIVRSALVLFHDYMRLTGLLRYDPRDVALDLPAGPHVVIANHPTLVDVTAIIAAGSDCAIIAKSNYFRSPVVGPLLRYCDHIEAGEGGGFAGAETMEEAMGRLAAGTPVLVFPEGTRSPLRALGKFRVGAFSIATRAEVPLVPLFITCEPPTLMRGQRWYEVPAQAPVMTVSRLPTIHTGGRDVSALARDVEEAYRRRVSASRTPASFSRHPTARPPRGLWNTLRTRSNS